MHLRGLADEFGESTNAIRKELNKLSKAGLLESEPERNKIIYKANTNHPFFNTISELVNKHLGLDVLVDRVLHRMGDVDKVVVTGDYANGLDSGVINISISGSDLNQKYLGHLSSKLESLIGRKVAFTIMNEGISENGMVLYDRTIDSN